MLSNLGHLVESHTGITWGFCHFRLVPFDTGLLKMSFRSDLVAFDTLWSWHPCSPPSVSILDPISSSSSGHTTTSFGGGSSISLSHQGIDWVVLSEDRLEVIVRLMEPLPLDCWAGVSMEVVATALRPHSTFPTLLKSVGIWLAIAESWVENVSNICVSISWTNGTLLQARLAGNLTESETLTSVAAGHQSRSRSSPPGE